MIVSYLSMGLIDQTADTPANTTEMPRSRGWPSTTTTARSRTSA
jgi:hypothetical protein